MNKERIIKAQAKAALNKNNWSTLAGCLAVLMVFFVFALYACYSLLYGFGAVDYASGEISDSKTLEVMLSSAVYVLLIAGLSPVINGYSRLCYNTAKYEACRAGDLLYYFKSPSLYFRALGLNAVKCIFLAAVCALCTIPADIMLVFGELSEGAVKDSFESTGTILTAMGILTAIIICTRLIFCNFVLAENENTKVFDCVRLAFKVTKGHTGDIILLLFSFIFWLLLCCFLIFPAFYAVPYMGTALATSAKWFISLKKEEVIRQC